jgi:antirestriction protein ArdC
MAEDKQKLYLERKQAEIDEQIIRMVTESKGLWMKSWKPYEAGQYRPFNPETKNEYQGLNMVLLEASGYQDERWLTFNNAKKAGYLVRKGSKAQTVEHWAFTKKADKLDENGRPVLDDQGSPEKIEVRLQRPMVRYYSVFNAAQLTLQNGEPLPPHKRDESGISREDKDQEVFAVLNKIVENSGARIFHDQKDRNYYTKATDEIHLVPAGAFDEPMDYHATKMHEIGHWTGHSSRLGRNSLGGFSNPLQPQEEAIAEMFSWRLAKILGLPHNPDSSAAYIKAWLGDPQAIPGKVRQCLAESDKCVKYVLGLAQEKAQAAGQALDLPLGAEAAAGAEMMQAGPAEKAQLKSSVPGVVLAVPYSEKDEAKKLGAKFDFKVKVWAAPEGRDPREFARWLPKAEIKPEPVLGPEADFQEVLKDKGFAADKPPVMNGQVQKISSPPEAAKAKKGLYKAVLGDQPQGFVNDLSDGTSADWIYTGQKLEPLEAEKEVEKSLKARLEARPEAKQEVKPETGLGGETKTSLISNSPEPDKPKKTAAKRAAPKKSGGLSR